MFATFRLSGPLSIPQIERFFSQGFSCAVLCNKMLLFLVPYMTTLQAPQVASSGCNKHTAPHRSIFTKRQLEISWITPTHNTKS